jgi:protein-S-isoprenylcysteine O-methyltransferase Ste14
MGKDASKSHSVRWTMRQRDIGVAAWVAFLAASVGTFVLFGTIDPGEIENAWMQQWEVSRKLAYSIGFLFLFVISLISSWLTVFMIRTGPRRGHSTGQGQQPVPEIMDPAENNPDLDLEELP